MIILPAIDIKDGQCVRLVRGDYKTAVVVASDPVETAKEFEKNGARWLHLVDLDGAKAKVPVNHEVVFAIRENTKMNIEIGGGIRDMESIDFYLERGIDRVILGSAAVQNPELIKEAVKKYGKKIAVGIDALEGNVKAEGWTSGSDVNYINLAKQMESLGVEYLIVTDIDKDGTLDGPNLVMLDKIHRSVKCNIIASGGVSNFKDILDLNNLGLYGSIAGKALYTKDLDLHSAVVACQRINPNSQTTNFSDELERYFVKSDLVPTIVQDAFTNEVLMMAYMNQESMKLTLETGYTWFYSRSRNELWNKGATSGNTQKVLSIHADCDDDTILIKVDQKGNACHTGRKSCFYKKLV